MTKLLALLISLLALSLTVAACGDDEDEGPNDAGGAAQTEAKPPPATTPAAGGGTSVSMKDVEFDPKELSVKQGATVTWTNDDSVGHDVTANDNSFKSGSPGGMQQGDTFKHRFTRTGEFAYKCTVHPNMTGTVRVTP